MKSIFAALFFALLVNSPVVQAESLTAEQRAIKSLIEDMYAIDPDAFEYATFGAKYNNKGERVVRGKHDADRQCRLLSKFLVKEAITKDIYSDDGAGENDPCMTGVEDAHFRYPGVTAEVLSSFKKRTAPVPKHYIISLIVNGNAANAQVNLEQAGYVVYYLKKLPVGWRIYRVESHESLPPAEDVYRIFPQEDQLK